MTEPLVSVVLVVYNSAADLPGCLRALADLDYEALEVIAVDNASTDASAECLAAAPLELTVVANARNEGFARACNQGAARARGEILFFLNPDIDIPADCVGTLVRDLDREPDAGIICPTVLRPGEPIPARPSGEPYEKAAIPGCSLMIGRAAWEDLGGFDDAIFLYWEDADLCWRAWLQGWRVLTDRQAFVHHEEGGLQGSAMRATQQLRNGLYVHLKLMRWRRVATFAVMHAAKTALDLARFRRLSILAAWPWNLRRLPATLRQRRAVAERRAVEPRELERRIAAQTRAKLRFRWLRPRGDHSSA
jgi:GT2 family glycosyltransferase